jgi:hypothetical protein
LDGTRQHAVVVRIPFDGVDLLRDFDEFTVEPHCEQVRTDHLVGQVIALLDAVIVQHPFQFGQDRSRSQQIERCRVMILAGVPLGLMNALTQTLVSITTFMTLVVLP